MRMGCARIPRVGTGSEEGATWRQFLVLGVSGRLPELAVPSGKWVTLGYVSTVLHGAPQRGLCSGGLKLSHWRLPSPGDHLPTAVSWSRPQLTHLCENPCLRLCLGDTHPETG